MPVYVVRITDRQKYGDQVTVHADMESGQQFIYYYARKRWDLHELDSFEDYNVADAIDKFFTELSNRYSYHMGLQDIHGAIEDDSDIVEMTPDEVKAIKKALEMRYQVVIGMSSYPSRAKDRDTLSSAFRKMSG